MASLSIQFQVVRLDTNKLLIPFIRYTKYLGPNYTIPCQYQDILLYHPDLYEILKTKKNVKSGEWVSCELSGSSLDKYYDLQKKRFWFKKKYLVAEYEDLRMECYFENSDPNDFISKFEKYYSKLDPISKLEKLYELVPSDVVTDLKFVSIDGYQKVIEFFLDKYNKIFNNYQLDQLCKKPAECTNLTSLISSKINFYESIKNIKFENYILFIEPLLNDDQRIMYNNYKQKIKNKDQLLKFAKMFDEYNEIKLEKKKEEENVEDREEPVGENETSFFQSNSTLVSIQEYESNEINNNSTRSNNASTRSNNASTRSNDNSTRTNNNLSINEASTSSGIGTNQGTATNLPSITLPVNLSEIRLNTCSNANYFTRNIHFNLINNVPLINLDKTLLAKKTPQVSNGKSIETILNNRKELIGKGTDYLKKLEMIHQSTPKRKRQLEDEDSEEEV